MNKQELVDAIALAVGTTKSAAGERRRQLPTDDRTS
jgi:hypothetical protein